MARRTLNVVLFGELYGSGVRDMAYGLGIGSMGSLKPGCGIPTRP